MISGKTNYKQNVFSFLVGIFVANKHKPNSSSLCLQSFLHPHFNFVHYLKIKKKNPNWH